MGKSLAIEALKNISKDRLVPIIYCLMVHISVTLCPFPGPAETA